MNKEDILLQTRSIFASQGYEGLSMRHLAKGLGCTLSVLYHYYPSKDVLLEEMFSETSRQLGRFRSQLRPVFTAADMLRQRIVFQFEHAEEVVAVLKYYLHFRERFDKNQYGYLPEKSSLHIEEVLEYGQQKGEFKIRDIKQEAKVITHAINGFLLEYYPAQVQQEKKEELAAEISDFLLRALRFSP